MTRSLLRHSTVAMAALVVSSGAGRLAPPCRAATRAAVGLTAYDVNGNVASIDVVAHTGSACLTQVCSDLALRYAGGRLYAVNRFGCDNIQVMDPANDFATVLQFSVGNGSNPQDIAVTGAHKAYVTRYGSADLWIVDPSTGAHTGTISLAAFADADGIPEMAQMLLLAGRLYVSAQRLDRNNFFAPTDHSDVVVIDAAADTVVDVDPAVAGVQAIRLTGTNPATDLIPAVGGVILVGEAGVYGVSDGGVDAIDRATLRASGYRATETALGGDVSDIDVVDAATAFAIVADQASNTKLVRFDPGTGSVAGTLATSNGFNFAAAALDGTGQILLADRSPTAPGGVRFFDVATGAENTAARLTFCLPPSMIAPLDEPVTGVIDPVGHGPQAASVRLERTGSAPSRGAATMTVIVERAARVRVAVVAADGRRVRALVDRVLPAGGHTLTWDGRTDTGRAVPAGVYRIVAAADGRISVIDAVIVR